MKKLIILILITLGVIGCNNNGIIGTGIIISKEINEYGCFCEVDYPFDGRHPFMINRSDETGHFWVECPDSVKLNYNLKFYFEKP